MNPIVHAELGWLVAQPLRARRDRLIVTLAGVAPDLDGLTLLGGTDLYGEYHHLLTHGYPAALATAAIAFAASSGTQRALTAALALVSFHLHLLCDLAGSGPGWPIHYFWPTSKAEWFWSGQWDLASWQNTAIGLTATLICLSAALWRGRTPVELFSTTADERVTATVRARIG